METKVHMTDLKPDEFNEKSFNNQEEPKLEKGSYGPQHYHETGCCHACMDACFCCVLCLSCINNLMICINLCS